MNATPWARRGLLSFFAAFFLVFKLFATPPNPSGTNTWLDSWYFNDTNWLSDLGYSPMALTNITAATGGDALALQVDSTNAAYLKYHVVEGDGTTNLTVGQGSIMLWFRPNWSSTNAGGSGPGSWATLVQTGEYTTNASYGWWSLYFDAAGCNLYLSTQTNDGTQGTFLSAPMSLISNVWHFLTLNYSSTNSQLYLDGALLTNGTGLTILPNAAVLTNGFCIGSDTNGASQMHGQIDDMETFYAPLDNGTIESTYNAFAFLYSGSMIQERGLGSAPSIPTYTNIVGGPGWLQYVTNSGSCVTNGQMYFTNVSCAVATNSTVTFTFAIAGGTNNVPYDLFGTTFFNGTNTQWGWLGQGYTCGIYTLTNQANGYTFYMLGTPQDSDGDGLTDAYELLVSHTNPYARDSNGDGMEDGWAVAFGLDPKVDYSASSVTRANYSYDLDGRLDLLFGIKAETIGLDFEGNVQSAH